MSVKLVLSNKDGMILYTKKTYVEDDIQLVLDEKLLPSGTVVITENGTHDVEKYVTAEINVDPRRPEQSKEVEYNENGQYVVSPEEGHVLTDVKVAVNVPIPEGYLKPEGNIDITNTAEVDVTNYATAKVVDDNLIAENIAENVTVLGITGTFRGGIDTSDATATSSDLLLGKTAYANEQKLVGTIEDYDYSNSEGIAPNDDYLDFLNGTFGDTYYAPEGALKIKGYSFYNNNTLEGLVCSSTIKELGGWCCRDAKKLKNVSLNNGLETIRQYAFYGCTSLEEIVIPETVNSIENYVFSGCTNLNKVNIPDGITVIQNYCFNGCSSLKTLTLPVSVKQANNYSLTFGSDGSSTLIVKATTPPTVTNLAMGSGVGKIIVPKGCLEAYTTATN